MQSNRSLSDCRKCLMPGVSGLVKVATASWTFAWRGFQLKPLKVRIPGTGGTGLDRLSIA